MNSLNKVQLIGNLTAEPVVKETPSGAPVANFSIATNRVWKDDMGNKQEQVEYHNIVAWNGLATLAEKYLSKGKKVYLEWRLQTRSWDDAESGTKRYRTEIVAENLIFLSVGEKKDGGDDEFNEAPATAKSKPAASQNRQRKQEEEIDISDIPF